MRTMFGVNLWRTGQRFLQLGTLTDAELLEAKDTFPLGTIKKYGEKHLYVKVGGKKPWVYYATLGTEKANAAIAAGGVVVLDGKAVGPATPGNLEMYKVQHPWVGGTPPLLDLSTPQGGATSAGMVSVPPSPAQEPEMSLQDIALAMTTSTVNALFKKFPGLKAKLKSYGSEPEIVANLIWQLAQKGYGQTAKDLESDNYGASSVEQKILAKLAAEMGMPLDPLPAAPKPKSGPSWDDFPKPSDAQNFLAPFIDKIDKGGGPDAMGPQFVDAASKIFGSKWKEVYGLAKAVQNLSHHGAPSPDQPQAYGILKYGDDFPSFDTKMTSLYGKDWREKAKLFGTQLKADNSLTPPPVSAPAAPPPPAPEPTPSVSELAALLKSGADADTLFAKHPDLKAKLQSFGSNHFVVINLIDQLAQKGFSQTSKDLEDGGYPPGHAINSTLVKLAKELGLATSFGLPPTSPVPPPATGAGVVPSSGKYNFVQVDPNVVLSDTAKMYLGYLKTPKKGQAYQAIKKLGYDHNSPEAKAVALLHKKGTFDATVNALASYGHISDHDAAGLLTKVVQDALKVGAFEWDSDHGIPTFPALKTKKKPTVLGGVSGGGSAAGAGSSYVPPPVVPTAPPVASAVPGEIPKPADLSLKGSGQHLGGAGQKQVWTDTQGKEYLFKIATSKDGAKVEPHRAEVQAAFSAVARKVKPNHPPIGVVTLGGKLGTIYPFVQATGNLKGVKPSTLTDTEKFDVASEHMLDWLGSQHDSHAANLLRTADGRVIGVDKEQGFKYFPDDRLDVDYHPNAKYGENEPFHNTFWRDWSDGKFEFDPQTLASTVHKVEAISSADYVAALRPYAQNRPKSTPYEQERFLRAALNRKLTLRRDFEKFLTGLYRKRTGEAGSFSFDSGWTPEGQKAKPKTKILTFSGPDYAQNKGIKVRDFETKDGTKDPTRVTLKVPKGSSPTDLEDTLKDLGLEPLGPIKTGSNNYIVSVSRASFEGAKVTKEVVIEDPKTGKFPPHPGVPTYFSAIEVSPPADPNEAELKSVHESKELGVLGKRINLDGGAVESQVAKVKRMKDAKGIYYMVHFKLREPVWSKMSGGTSASLGLHQTNYDPSSDAQVEHGYATVDIDTKLWQVGGNELHVATKKHEWSYMGGVYTKIRPKAGQTIEDALRELLDAAKPGLSKQILRDPAPEEREISKLSRLLWAVAPQVSDSLPESDRTVSGLRDRLKQAGVTDEEVASMREVEFMPGHSTYIIPGRWKKLAKTSSGEPAVRFLQYSVSTPSRIVSQIQNGLLGIHERALTGQAFFGASASADVSTGCADGATLRLITASGDGHDTYDGWGDYSIIISPDECDRLDLHMFMGDTYGCTNPNHSSYGSSYKNRKPLAGAVQSQQSSYHPSAEIVVRRGVSSKKFLRINANSEQKRAALIAELKKAGIDEVNGVPVEDFVIVGGTKGDVYKKYVKPAGF